jgi:Glycosyltransferase family 87
MNGSAVSTRQPLGITRLGTLVVLGAFPVIVTAMVFVLAWGDDAAGLDFGQFYFAAEAILRGEDPYTGPTGPNATWGGEYPYPPLPGFLAVPLTVLSLHAAKVLVMVLLVAAALAIPFVLDVRDWRCYGLLLLWPPVISAIQTGNLTLFLGLAAALAWRFRDSRAVPSALVGLTLAAKFFLWPLVVWFAATRRLVTAGLTVGVAIVLLTLSWAAIGFAGLADYPALTRRLQDAVGMDAYTLYILGLDLGLPSPLARLLWMAVGGALVAAVVLVARRGDERSAFILAIAASLALTPIVWLHYFALLLLVVALAQPRLGPLWFLPLGMVVTPGSGQPTPFETAATLAIAALVVGLALRTSLGARGWGEDRRPSTPLASAADS